MKVQLHRFLWYTATAAALIGSMGMGTGWQSIGSGLVAIGGGVLTALALATAWRIKRSESGRTGDHVLTVIAAALAFLFAAEATTSVLIPDASTTVQVVLFATGAQLLFLAVHVAPSGTSRSTQWAVPIVSHLTIVGGSALALEWGPIDPGAALLAYATGFSSLALHTFWMRRLIDKGASASDTTGRWEAALVLTLIASVAAAAAAVFTTPTGDPIPEGPVASAVAVVAGIAGVTILATFAEPPPLPSVLEPLTGTVITVFQHATVLVILLNALLLAALFAFGGFFWLLGVFLAWLVIAVTLEYLAVAYAHSEAENTPPSPPPLPDDAPVTVVVTAAFEADVLPESLAGNLEALEGLPFMIVPAAKSTDGTIEVAREFERDYPNRVRVVEGTTGSKAGDLNQAWQHLETPYALVLDADEIVDAEFVARGLRVLRERPEVGVVQGRKAAANPDRSPLSRFVSMERQHSTWVDHPFVDDVLDAGHFAGSAAIFRREVPPAVDGWLQNTLTEDIDLTLRLYLETDWLVEYVPEMVVRESHPATFRALVRQRVRWARGWAQVTVRYTGDILRSRRKLGRRRTVGLVWLLFTSVSAPAYTIFPALVLLWLVGLAPALPLLVALPLALFMLPARAVSFGYAAFRDPVIPFPTTPKRVAESVFYAYLWILFGWFVQLHALYLQLASSPRLWYVTEKSGAATGSESG